MKTALVIVLLIISVILAIVIMMQEGKEGGLASSISGTSETYWSKNKGKSKEAVLRKLTAFLGLVYIVIALILSSKFVK